MGLFGDHSANKRVTNHAGTNGIVDWRFREENGRATGFASRLSIYTALNFGIIVCKSTGWTKTQTSN